MLTKIDAPIADWRGSVEGVITLGKFLTLKHKEMTLEEFKKFTRTEIELDENSAMKIMNIAKHPILSNPEHWERLPYGWGLLYELRFMSDAMLMEGIKSGAFIDITKYKIWEMRGVKRRAQSSNEGRGVKVPPGIALVDYCRSGLAIERDTKEVPEIIAKKLGIGAQTYRMVRAIILLSERPELSDNADSMD